VTIRRPVSKPAANTYEFIDPDLEEEYVGCMLLAGELAADGNKRAADLFITGLQLDPAAITTQSLRIILDTQFSMIERGIFPLRSLLLAELRSKHGLSAKILVLLPTVVLAATYVGAIPALADRLNQLLANKLAVQEAQTTAWG
jgi:hypothetical protein